MKKELRYLPFYIEKRQSNKDLRNLNSQFTAFLLDHQFSNLNNFSCFFITILFKDLNQQYNFY